MNRKIIFTSFMCFLTLASCSAKENNASNFAGKQDRNFSRNMAAVTQSNYVPAEGARTFSKSENESIPETTTKVSINLSKTECSSSNNNAVAVTYKNGIYTITGNDGAGNFHVSISGKSENAAISIEADKKSKIVIVLDNAVLTSKNTPCISVSSKSTVYLSSVGTSILNDGRQYGTLYGKKADAGGSKDKGTVYAKGAVILKGNGTIEINENYKHGFYAGDFIHVISGTNTVNSTGRNGFQSVNAFLIDGGTVNVNGSGKNTNNESRGIIVEGSEDNPGEGFIEIRGGTININTVSKAISAKWELAEDAETETTADDPYPYVKVSGGTVNITTTGTPREDTRTSTFTDADGETVSEAIKCSPEGIEGKQAVFITGGTININTTDDAINASRDDPNNAAVIEISGGTINVTSSKNDGIDSNGIINIKGGTLSVIATSVPECAFDCDQNQFAITGGTILGIGSSNFSSPTVSACKNQGTFVLNGGDFTNGNKLIVKNGKKEVFSCEIPNLMGNDNVIILSSPDFKIGETYTVYSGTKEVESKVKFTTETPVFTSSNVRSGFMGGGRGGFMKDGRGNGPENFDGPRDLNPPEGFDPNNRPEGFDRRRW